MQDTIWTLNQRFVRASGEIVLAKIALFLTCVASTKAEEREGQSRSCRFDLDFEGGSVYLLSTFPSGLVAMIRRDYGRVKIKIWKLTVRDYFLKFRVWIVPFVLGEF